jgi:hypothetical protein
MEIGGSPSAFSQLSLDNAAIGVILVRDNGPWTARSFFDPPRVNAPQIVEFGQGKTYDFFA